MSDEETRPPARAWGAPAAIFAGAFAVRLAAAIEAWHRIPFLRAPVVDGAEYFLRAREVAAGEWWPRKMEIHPPLYGWFAGTVFAVFGDASFALYLLQALLGAATAVLLWRFTKLLAGPRAAVAAGALAALAWPAVLQEIQPSAAGLELFLAAAALNLAAWASKGRPLRALAPGLAVGLAGIAHGMMLAFALVLLLPLLERSKRGLLAAAAGLAAALIPALAVCAHHASLDDGSYGLQANVGLNLWIGSNDGADGFPNIPQGPPYDDLVDGAWRAGHMTAAEQDAYFRGRAVRWAASHPFRWAGVCGKRLLGTWSAAEVDSSMDAGIFEEGAASWLAAARWWLIAGLALPGAVLLWKRPDRRLWLAAAVAALAPLVLVVTSNRYRVPLLVALVPAAGAALEAAWTERRRLGSKAGAALAALAVAGGALSLANPLRVPTGAYFDRDVALGSSRASLGDYVEAEARLAAALARRPGDPYVLLLLARVRWAAGARPQAIATLLQALDARPGYFDALVDAGNLLPEAGREDDVLPLFRRAAAAAPDDPRIFGAWGQWLLQCGRTGEAVEPLQRATELQPRKRSWRTDLGDAFFSLHRVDDAEPLYLGVLKDDPDNLAALFGAGSCALLKGRNEDAARYAARAAELGHPAAAALLDKATRK